MLLSLCLIDDDDIHKFLSSSNYYVHYITPNGIFPANNAHSGKSLTSKLKQNEEIFLQLLRERERVCVSEGSKTKGACGVETRDVLIGYESFYPSLLRGRLDAGKAG